MGQVHSMIPGNRLSVEPVVGKYYSPDNRKTSLLEWRQRGGIALQDPSQGLDLQSWYGVWSSVDSTVYLTPALTGIAQAIFTEPDVVEFSFAFDSNMRWTAVTRKADGVIKLRWYDATIGGYATTEFTGVYSVKLCHDDKRKYQVTKGASDVILSYIKGNSLYWRVQRDRYEVEYLGTDDLTPGVEITNFGMNDKYRLQWRLAKRLF